MPRRRTALRLLALATAAAAGFSAHVTPEAATWFGVRGPACPLGACLGPLACPGCGLVRATALALQGDPCGAWSLHPAGPVIAFLLLAAIAVDVDILRRGNEMRGHAALRRAGHRTLAFAVLAAWLLRSLAL